MKTLSFKAAGADRRKLAAIVSSSLLTLVFVARAHPGHKLGDATPQHLLTSPDHLAVLALSGAAFWFAGRLVQRRLPRRLLQGAGVTVILAAAIIWGVAN